MYAIFNAEFLRYRKWAFMVLLAQLGIWIFVARLMPLLEAGAVIRSFSYLTIVFGSLGFGALQMYLHRRKNDWTYLIHRPLAPHKIYLALAGAGIACIALALPLGWLIMVAGLDISTNAVVDFRHYMHAFYSCSAAISAYLIGGLIIISASRGAFLLLGLLTLVLTDIPANTSVAFTIALILIAILLYLNASSFRPDPKIHLADKHTITLMSLPMQFGIVFILVLSTTVFYHIPRFMIGNHPDNNPEEGAYNYLWQLNEAEQVTHLLKDSNLPNKAALIRQADIADFEQLHSYREEFPIRGQLHFKDEQNGISHADTNSHWAFSHDSMVLQGNHIITGDIVGYFGMNGFIDADAMILATDRFDSVPFIIGDQYLQTRQTLYEIDFSERLLSIKFALDGKDSFRTRPNFRDNFVALTSENFLFLFDPEEFDEEQEPAFADYAIPHPEMHSPSAFMGLYRMVDGYLIVYHESEYNAFDSAGAEIVYARLGGSIESIHKIAFSVRVHPAPIQHFAYAVSPVLDVTKQALFRAIDPSNTRNRSLGESSAMPMPTSVQLTAAILALLAVVCVVILARRIQLERSRMTLWTVMAAIFGLPALISFGLMNKLRSDVG